MVWSEDGGGRMKGQLTIYYIPKDKPRPCDYKFQRYIGQKVKFVGKYSCHKDWTGHIVEIFPYYTYVQTAQGVLVGTPYDLQPLEETAWSN